jgi:hypothetical protein
MKRALAMLSIAGCGPPTRQSLEPDVTLEQAQAMMLSGRVVEVFQPHLDAW